jgi:16S rRNA (guanine966-N2)-methyltransferase
VSLRVIAGIARGRKLKSVPGESTRPITDRVKEALFNILAGDLQGSTWWDLFAGTGAVGIEALSRGASFVRFSDLIREPVEIIKHNLKRCGFTSAAEVRRGDAFNLLASQPDRTFDFLYVAPPQYKAMWSKSLALIDDYPDWVKAEGLVIVQIHPKEYQTLALSNLEELDSRKYSNTRLLFYQLKEEFLYKKSPMDL